MIYLIDNNTMIKHLASIIGAMINYTYDFLIRFWEVLSYLIIASLLYYFNNEYIVLLMSFLSGVLVTFSIFSRTQHEKRADYVKLTSWALTLLWGGLAFFFQNNFIGFIAVAAFISSIGFSFSMSPGMISIGFQELSNKFILRLTGITFFISIFSWILFYTNFFPILSTLKLSLRVFQVGMVSLIPLVYFLGIGYMSFILYKNNPRLKLIGEVTALVSGVFVLTISLLYEISSMFWIGLLFMAWDLIDKYFQLVYKRIDFVWSGLILAAILGGSGYLIKSNVVSLLSAFAFLSE